MKKLVNIMDLSEGGSGKTKIVDYLANGPCYFFGVCCKIVGKNCQSQIPSGFSNKKMSLIILGDINTNKLTKEIIEHDIDKERILLNNKESLCDKDILVELDNGTSLTNILSVLQVDFTKYDFLNIGVFKAYKIKTDKDYFLTEIKCENSTSKIRIGHLDLVELKSACDKNCITNLAITKIDTLFKSFEFKVCIEYSEKGCVYKTFKGDPLFNFGVLKKSDTLSNNIVYFLNYIEVYLGLPISLVSYGRNRNEILSSFSFF